MADCSVSGQEGLGGALRQDAVLRSCDVQGACAERSLVERRFAGDAAVLDLRPLWLLEERTELLEGERVVQFSVCGSGWLRYGLPSLAAALTRRNEQLENIVHEVFVRHEAKRDQVGEDVSLLDASF